MADKSNSSSGAAPSAESPASIRNVVLVGPSGAGKTTLVEALLFHAGVLSRTGTVLDGTTVCDYEPAEVEQQRSVGLALASLQHGPVKVNLLDTPGYADFVGELRAGLRAADCALFVMAANEVVDAATRTLWRECAEVGMPRAVVVTKLDHARASFAGAVQSAQESFGDKVIPLYLPGDAELISQLADDAALIEGIIEESEDETLMERYLGGEQIDNAVLVADLERAVARGSFFPVIPVCSTTGTGAAELLDVIARGFPSPPEHVPPQVFNPAGVEKSAPACDPDAPLLAEVVKTTSDPYVGKVSLVRVFAGTIRPDTTVHVSGHFNSFVDAAAGCAEHDDHDEDASPEAAAAGSDAPAAAAQKKTQWVTTLVLIEYFTQLFPKWCWKEHPQREAVTVLWDGSTMHGTVVLLLYLSAAVQSNVGDILACSYEGDAWSPSAIAAARLPDISARRLITFQAKYGLDMTLPRPSADAGGVERKFLIRIRTLPPNCTALVQPADRGFIKLLKSTAVNEFTRTHEPPTMTEVPALAKKLNADFLMRSLAKTAAALEPENVQPFWYAICPELRRDRAQEKFDATKKVSEEAQKVVNAEVSRGVGQHVKTAAKETAETANKAHREATAELQRARDKLGDANKLIEDMRAEMQREDIEFRAKMANLRNPPQPKSRSRAAAKRNPPAAAAASASTAPKVTAPVVVSVPGAATVPGGPIEQADAQRAGSAEAPPRARKRPAPAGARAPVRVGAPAAKSRAFGRRN